MDATIKQFSEVTGCDADRARLLVEAAGGDLEGAVTAFFAEDGGAQQAPPPARETAVPNPRPAQVQRTAARSTAPSSYSSGPRIATFGSLASSDEPPPNTTDQYVGGEKSGIAVQGNDGKGPRSQLKGLFDAARQQGATEAPGPSGGGAAAAAATSWGKGFTLGDNEVGSAQVGQSAAQPRSTGLPKVTITFYKEGFTVDNGRDEAPLRRQDDPANAAFLESIRNGVVPPEIGRDVEVALKDESSSEYVKPAAKAFSGSGFRLGAAVPDVVMSTNTAEPAATPAPQQQPATAVDESLPTTRIQLRLANGTRLVAKFNPTQTVQDIRNFVDAAEPSQGNYVLMTTFPNKKLEDMSQTIDDAKLCNAQIVQRNT